MKYCPECGNELRVSRSAGPISCHHDGCAYINWDNPVPVVAALVSLNGQYIVARNSRWPERIYSLITGYVESREDVEDGALREVKEELGLEGRIKRFLGHFTFQRKNQLIIAFEVIASGTVQLSDEIAEIKLLSEKELRNYDFRPLTITERIIGAWSTQPEKGT